MVFDSAQRPLSLGNLPLESSSPSVQLHQLGQSVWLDYIRRCMIKSGELQRLIQEEGVRGITSNPAIFQKAIAGSTDYNQAIALAEEQQDRDSMGLYEQLAIEDIQATADLLRPVYEESNYRDGYVSLEVSPYLADDTEQTILEAQRLWQAVQRPNLMIKVPATEAGIPAIQTLIGRGINVNVTLLFSQAAYQQAAEAYVAGLETFQAQGGDLQRVASVASFFISRIDSAVDAQIEAQLRTLSPGSERRAELAALQGTVAIANAKLAYRAYLNLCESDRWQTLVAQGAQPQRLLWASTGTKNPQYSDVLYVESLIGPNTVNTIPPATFAAFQSHGQAEWRLLNDVDQAAHTLAQLAEADIDLEQITDQLLEQGVDLFQQAFDQLLSAVEQKRTAQLGDSLNRMTYELPQVLEEQVLTLLEQWQASGRVRQLWAQDSRLWTGEDEHQWLGWLGITEDQLAHLEPLKSLSQWTRSQAIDHVVLLGMGGSSLCPEVLKLTFGSAEGYPTLLVLDSTDPAEVQAIAQQIDPARTLFIVSSKSGSTLEPNIFKQYFFELVQQQLGDKAGERFIAVTDPGSQLQQIAEQDGFKHLFFGLPSIGGRYSALSNFGLVPAACIGLDVQRFLDSAEEMVHSCAASVPALDNPGVVLGTILGAAAQRGQDKLTLITSPGIASLGAWLEQLLAESTGKQGNGIIPVDQEPLGSPQSYGGDRLFAYIRLESDPDPEQDRAVEALIQAGQPVVRIRMTDIYQLGQEFFRWEMATAVAGSILQINAFNQPDVEASKIATRKLTQDYERTGQLPQEVPLFEEAGLKLFTDPSNAAALSLGIEGEPMLSRYLRAHFDRLRVGDYFALLAYVHRNPSHEALLQSMRQVIRDRQQVATCLGFGPRFLHSTGQAYKGGPNTGVFLQLTCEDANDLAIPGQRYSFGVVKAAQAQGDLQVLAERQRRMLRIHLGQDVEMGLQLLRIAIGEALS